MTPVVEARGLEVAYGKVTVLEDVDFRVDPGERVALLGTNGAGKSTLLKTISGILQPRAGTLLVDGDDAARWRPSRVVARGVVQMPGGRATFPGLTIEENLVLGGITVPRRKRLERVGEVLEWFPWLAERRNQLAGTLSGGQQQMLALARALMTRPRLLMVDELSLGLAPTIVTDLLDVLMARSEEGMAIVLVDQHVNMALDVTDRAYFLERGRVRFEGAAGDLRGRRDLLRAVFFAGATA